MSVATLRNSTWAKGRWAVGIFLAFIGVLLTRDAWIDILHIAWRDEESSHIFLVPIAIIWLVRVRRHRLRFCRPNGSYLGPLMVGIGWIISMVGYENGIQYFWHGGAILIAVGCFTGAVGKDVLFRFFPAIVALAFLVPVPGMIRQQIAIPMQTIIAQVTHSLLELMGANIERSGNLLTINGQPVAIAEACNGMRMVFALALVSYTFAFGTPLRWYVRTIILALSPLFAIICNVIRMIPTVWLYGYSPATVADAFHDLGGWAMLFVAFGLLMAIIRLMEWTMVPVHYYNLAKER